MSEARAVNPLVQQFRAGGVPRDLRLLAAQGALPLKPVDLLELLHHLLADHDPEVAGAAQASLVAQPAAEILPLLKDRETPPQVLAWAAAHRSERELREAVLQNTSLPDQAIEALAPGLSEHLAELVVINQVRLLRRTSLLEALEGNQSLSNDQRRRLRELRESFRIGELPAPSEEPAAEAAAPAEEPAPVEEAAEEPILTEDEALARYLTEAERGEQDKVGAVQKVFRLNTAHKVILALKGTREERTILVRDPNRIVSSAVLGSPKLSEAEIEAFAAMRNISQDVLRQIGNHREWTKRYTVLASLVKNPRTPVGVSMSLVSRMNPRDMRGLTTDRNVPEVIRKHAQKFVRGALEKK
jgi:pyruvate/2-oxoglutarate dehydrogenase complex dihydrolipoamide acyltransferase (E2) component